MKDAIDRAAAGRKTRRKTCEPMHILRAAPLDFFEDDADKSGPTCGAVRLPVMP